MGSTRIARTAGTMLAAAASASTPTTTTEVAGSVERVSNSHP